MLTDNICPECKGLVPYASAHLYGGRQPGSRCPERTAAQIESEIQQSYVIQRVIESRLAKATQDLEDIQSLRLRLRLRLTEEL